MVHRQTGCAFVFFCTLCFTLLARADTDTLPLEIGDPRNGPPDNPLNINSGSAAISRSGMFVTFHCYASNIVPYDTNGLADIFVLNRRTGAAERVSVHSDGSQSNGASLAPRISGNGRYVAFQSGASNLVDGDTNAKVDIFLHDRVTHETTRVSVSSAGAEGNYDSMQAAISANGRYVAFASSATNLVSGDTNGKIDVFVHDIVNHTTRLVSGNFLGLASNGDSLNPSISDDGRFIAFESRASDLVVGDFNNNWDIFVYDMQYDTMTRASVSTNGAEANGFCVAPSITADGSRVAFLSGASNLVSGDTNNAWDCFVHDLQQGWTIRASVNSAGQQANGLTQFCAISGDGTTVSMRSFATNLVSNDTNYASDIFLRDLVTQQTTRASINAQDSQANDDCYEGQLGLTGDYVVFVSEATNLNPQANQVNVFRVFVRGLPLTILGDLNRDGRLDGDDIGPFVALALGSNVPYDQLGIVDFNGDGVFDSSDVTAFIRCLATDCGN